MSRGGGRGAGRGIRAAAPLLVLLAAACAEPEAAAPEDPAPDPPPQRSVLGLPASDLVAEVEAGTGRITLTPRPVAADAAPVPAGSPASAGAREEAAPERRRRPRRDPEADLALAETRRQIGRELEATGDIEGAVAEYEAALAAPWTGPTSETPWADLARLCRRGEPAATVARACAQVLNPVRFAPAELAEFLAHRGNAHARLGRAELALADYRAALEIESSNFRALVGRARLMLREGKPAAALNDLRLAISTGPRPAEARLVRAEALAALGDQEGAVAHYDAMLADMEAAPWHRAAWRGRAETHCAMGQPEAAAVDWQVWADSVPGGVTELQEMLRARGYLRGPWEAETAIGLGPATLAGLRAWTREGCP